MREKLSIISLILIISMSSCKKDDKKDDSELFSNIKL